MTGADGTTFIVAYQYANDEDLDEITEAATREITNKLAQTSAPQLSPDADPAVRQPPMGNLGSEVDREFLEGFLSGRECLPGGTGWWRYEICYGKHVIQYHVRPFIVCVRMRAGDAFAGGRSASIVDLARHMESRQAYRMAEYQSQKATGKQHS